MMTSSVKSMFEDLLSEGKISRTSLIGCSNDEIVVLENHFDCELPRTYRDFLEIAGKRAGKLFCGTDIFYPRVLQLQSEARDLLAELDQPVLLPISAKVFCMHQGYELNYFIPENDDPPVFQFFEGQSTIENPWRSFSEFLRTSIENHIEQWPNLD